jgi:hypothetical protein
MASNSGRGRGRGRGRGGTSKFSHVPGADRDASFSTTEMEAPENYPVCVSENSFCYLTLIPR